MPYKVLFLTAEWFAFHKFLAALAIYHSAVHRISHTIGDGAEQICLHILVIYRGENLDAVDEVSWHPVGRTDEVSWLASVGKR